MKNFYQRQLSYSVKRLLSTSTPKSKKDLVGLIGICEDRNSSYLTGARLAPPKIRECLNCDSSNGFSEANRIHVASHIYDYGDYHPGQNFGDITNVVGLVCSQGRVPLILGGDHSITAPVFAAVSSGIREPITIVHFDAHPDLYPTFENNVHSHASPFARILEKKESNNCKNLIQIGIRTINDLQQEQILKYGVKIIEAKDFPAKGTFAPFCYHFSPIVNLVFIGSDISTELQKYISSSSPVYISIDIDVLEPVTNFDLKLSFIIIT
jgi:arginase family enzyme